MKHSPGKWEAEFVGHGGPGDNPVEVWEVTNGHARIAENMTEADARLTAAGPELIAALQKVAAFYSKFVPHLSSDEEEIFNAVQAAIARA